ncbi:SHOCT-like domain-containing protein [Bacillus suaedaesalsae]|uniref:YvlB/LiaX N-terminal domain-containing protein n=1 Tax=Bacillus suaedaesalsae TaxID=2810349 RepID=A0ABS2DDP3_9BACI|nr:hypothetical protein [Bacillus suaedaesalsae]MBM6616574.1 hypothetical protein [Bacillus suaedaesalsae]
MKSDISKVLELLQDGKLNNEEAAEILSALKEETAPTIDTNKYMEKSLKILVDSVDGDKVKVNLPLKLVKSLHGAIGHIPAVQQHLNGVDINLILEAIVNNVEGPIVDVESADGEKVLIVIE